MVEVGLSENRKFNVESNKGDVLINGELFDAEIVKISKTAFKVFNKKTVTNVDIVSKRGKQLSLLVNNKPLELEVSDHIDQILKKLGMDESKSVISLNVKAPMPGTILDIYINEGDEVLKNDPILVLEAMKMENVIKSPNDGTIKSIHVSTHQNVEKNELLVSFKQ